MKKVITNINVDMDDVIFDWQGYVGARLAEFDDAMFEKSLSASVFGSVDAYSLDYIDRNIIRLNEMDTKSRYDLLQLYYAVYPNTFRDIYMMDGIKEMLISLRYYADNHGINLNILSAIGEDHPNPSLVREHKLEAIDKRLPIKFDNIKIVDTSKCKIRHHEDNCILIDDFKRNIKEWESVGGIGIHHTCPKKTIRDLAAIVNP